MTNEEQIIIIKQLREITGAGMFECKRALYENNFNIEKSIKYLRHIPTHPPLDYWTSHKYVFCKCCDRWFDVKRTIKKCEVCKSDFIE